MEKNSTKSARQLVLDLLLKAEKSKQFSNIALDKALEASILEDADRRLVSVLFYGVIERLITLDHRIEALSSRPIEKIDTPTLYALRLGLYQLIYTRIPAHAAINETVELCPRRTAGFVNGILRSHTRTEPTPLPDIVTAPVKHLSVKHSVCEALCERFVKVFGAQRADSVLAAFGNTPPTTLRVNTLKTSREKLLSRIDGAEPTALSSVGLRVKGSVRDIYGFSEGLFFVQDEASQLCVAALDARPHQTVMDICACPGSKSFGAAIDMENTGRVLSFDLHAKKLSLITSGAKRLGIDTISVSEQDGRVQLPDLLGQADRVLCDVPCSGFGVLAKKPELRYKDPEGSDSLPDIQLAILENACGYVKEGGTLVYSTCTVIPEENELNLKRFLASHPEFSLCSFNLGERQIKQGYITLLPDEYPTDGFFIAKLIRGTL